MLSVLVAAKAVLVDLNLRKKTDAKNAARMACCLSNAEILQKNNAKLLLPASIFALIETSSQARFCCVLQPGYLQRAGSSGKHLVPYL